MKQEPILIRLRPSPLAVLVPMDWLGLYGKGVVFSLLPWRGLLISLLVVTAGMILAASIGDAARLIVSTATVMALFPPMLELLFGQEYISPTHYSKRYGLLGRGRVEIPLTAFDWVEVEYPRFGEFWAVGTIVMCTEKGKIVVQGVSQPERVVHRIQELVARAKREAGDGPPRRSPDRSTRCQSH